MVAHVLQYFQVSQGRKSQSESNQKGDRETCTQLIRSLRDRCKERIDQKNARSGDDDDDHDDELAAVQQREVVQLRATNGVQGRDGQRRGYREGAGVRGAGAGRPIDVGKEQAAAGTSSERAQSSSAAQASARRRGRSPADKEHRRLKRLLRNRVSAQQARERKKAYMSELEARVKDLEKRNSELDERLSTLQNENQMLRQAYQWKSYIYDPGSYECN